MSDVKGLHFVRKSVPGKPIRWYVFAWRGKGAPCILKSEGPKRPKLDAAALKALADLGEEEKAAKAATLGGLVRQWRGNPADLAKASPEWRGLAASTRILWGAQLDLIEAKWGALPIALWNDPRMVAKVVEWRDSRAGAPRSADIGVTVLSELLKFGKLRARVLLNVAADVPAIYKPADRAEIIWTDDDLAKAKAAAAQLKGSRVLDVIRLACLTGMRRADLAALTWDEVSEHAIIRTALKKSRGRRRRAVIPVVPALAELLDELRTLPRAEGVRTVLVSAKGLPWKPESMTAAVIELARSAGIEEPAQAELDMPARRKHLHDCRGTFVTHLCRVGLTDAEIANIVAWSVESVSRIRRTYVDDAAIVVALSHRIRQAV
ncbi:site-specific integrase [Sphingomonadaceae bacterium G21617-S1]|nr:site-specific integrase [Sphingomonadaceae bacterium G21617-S1]